MKASLQLLRGWLSSTTGLLGGHSKARQDSQVERSFGVSKIVVGFAIVMCLADYLTEDNSMKMTPIWQPWIATLMNRATPNGKKVSKIRQALNISVIR